MTGEVNNLNAKIFFDVARGEYDGKLATYRLFVFYYNVNMTRN
jgi:hypothetical protein